MIHCEGPRPSTVYHLLPLLWLSSDFSASEKLSPLFPLSVASSIDDNPFACARASDRSGTEQVSSWTLFSTLTTDRFMAGAGQLHLPAYSIFHLSNYSIVRSVSGRPSKRVTSVENESGRLLSTIFTFRFLRALDQRSRVSRSDPPSG